MKKVIKLVGIITLLAVIMISMAGCWRETCEVCGGSGKCQTCRGSGIITEDHDVFAGTSYSTSVACPDCFRNGEYPGGPTATRNSGICKNCHGTGETKEGLWWE